MENVIVHPDHRRYYRGRLLFPKTRKINHFPSYVPHASNGFFGKTLVTFACPLSHNLVRSILESEEQHLVEIVNHLTDALILRGMEAEGLRSDNIKRPK